MEGTRPNTATLLPLDQYDRVIVSFSGGKDSLACVLHMLELGVPKERLELWHHLVDGAPGTKGLMDWPCTESYCKAVAAALGIPIRFSWREGGFEREMTRDGTATAPVSFEDGDWKIVTVGGDGPAGTRQKFPQVTADLKTRYCSAALKIDVGRRVFARDPRFKAGKFLFVTGERRQESAARSRYAEVDEHASSTVRGRKIHQWRVVIDWPEEKVWETIKRHGIVPHVAYYLGWSRVSCALCIFGGPANWRSARELAPAMFDRVAAYEEKFGVTIRRSESVRQAADKGESFLPTNGVLHGYRELALGTGYTSEMVVVPPGREWEMPSGAFKRGGGPT